MKAREISPVVMVTTFTTGGKAQIDDLLSYLK
jgi:hypothetical protein